MLRVARRVLLPLFVAAAVVYGTTIAFVIARLQGTATLPAECAIVFGTAVHPVYDERGRIVSARAGPGILRRVSTAAALYRQGMIRRVFLSGGKGEGSLRSEAQVMRDVAEQRGIPPSAITVEDRSRSTRENLEFTRPLTSGCSSLVAISDGYHLARIELLADSLGWRLQTVPAADRPSRAFILRNLLREAIGIDLLVLVHILT